MSAQRASGVPNSLEMHAAQSDQASNALIEDFFPASISDRSDSDEESSSMGNSEHASAVRNADTADAVKGPSPSGYATASTWLHGKSRLPVPDWLERRCACVNLRLKMTLRMSFGMQSLECSPDYGLLVLGVAESACRHLLQLVCTSRDEYGLLRVAGVSCRGLGTYPSEAETQQKGVRYRVQEQWTSVIPPDKVLYCIEREPRLLAVVNQVCQRLGADRADVAMVHFLCQLNPFAVWPWHDDAFDLQLSKHMLTVVCALNEIASGVQIYGFEPFMYTGVGCTVAFLGAGMHRSVVPSLCSVSNAEELMIWDGRPDAGPVKVVLFLDKKKTDVHSV